MKPLSCMHVWCIQRSGITDGKNRFELFFFSSSDYKCIQEGAGLSDMAMSATENLIVQQRKGDDEKLSQKNLCYDWVYVGLSPNVAY